MKKQYIRTTEIGMGMRCQMALYLKKKIGPRPPSGAATRGTSLHKAMQVNFQEKVSSGKDAPIDVCTDVFRDEFYERMLNTNFNEDEKPERIFDEGISMTKLIHEEVCPPIYPKSLNDIERSMKIDCGDFYITGITDLLDVADVFWDWKSANRKWAKMRAQKEVQGFVYPFGVMLADNILSIQKDEEGDNLLLPFNFVIATKKGEIQLFEVQHRIESAKAIIGFARQLIRMIREGTPIANPGNNLCSLKWCAYHYTCPIMRGKFIE